MDDTLLDTIEKRINRIMVGRYSEMEMFKKQFDHVLEGGMGLTVVSGRPGIGKTFFVDRAVSLAIGGNATYLRGKFRQYDSKPLLAVAEVIEQAVRYILILPTESLKHIKYELVQKQGADPAVILAICPYAEKLFGSRKAINIDSLEQLKYRVKMAVCFFLETVSTALFPLIIFLDDLQWADAVSMNIIEALCRDHEYLNLHLVLAYREGDAGQARLNQEILPEGGDILIELGGLNYEDIDQYIRLILSKISNIKTI
jgi:predicted ATPase